MSGKTVVVAGFGKSGQALCAHALSLGARVLVADDTPPPGLPPGVDYAGPLDVLKVMDYDELWTSPGIAPRRLPVDIRKQRGELDLAQACLAPGQQVVAVSGTNGKTTTTELVLHLLTRLGVKALAVGNIGQPWITALDPDVAVYVVEVSSFQLMQSRWFHPHVAVLTNIASDHLEWHGDEEGYRLAKWRIARWQTSQDFLVVGQEALFTPPQGHPVVLKAVWGHDVDQHGDHLHLRRPVACEIPLGDFPLLGEHNRQNLAMAAMAVLALGHTPQSVAGAVAGFSPSAHRQQNLGLTHGVQFVNDSKATNPHAVLAALNNVDRPILIYGGFDKGLADEQFLAAQLPRLKALVLLGPLGERLLKSLPLGRTVSWGKNLTQAFEQAVALASAGDTVLLSPGSSSFDEFKDYKERGEHFAALVRRFADAPAHRRLQA